MARSRRIAPVWLIGLAGSPFGFYGGIVFYAIPQLLAARHVPEVQIAGLSGMLILPFLLGVFVAPILDVHFSRRWYATVCCTVAALLMTSALLNMGDLRLLGGVLFGGVISMSLFAAALGGWLASVIPIADQPTLSAWSNIGNIGAGGVMAYVSVRLIRLLPLPVACVLLGCMILVPMAIFPFIPAPTSERRLARESFGGLLGAIMALFRRSDVLVVLLLFGLPSASFTLTNILSGLGRDFHTPESTVSLLNGAGVTFAGVLACLLGGWLCARLPLRQLYLGIGIVGSLFTLSLLLLGHNPVTFGIATLGENAFQALAFTTMTALTLRTVGHGNPLAATETSILGATANFPLFYMQFVDSHAYAARGPAGAFATDAAISIMVCAGLLGLLAFLRRRNSLAELTPATMEESH